MANESEDEILLSIAVDEGDSNKKVVDLKKQLDWLRSAAIDLQKDLDKGAITQKQYGEAMGRINAQSKVLTTELKAQEKALADAQKTTQRATDSIVAMKANVAKMAEEWENLSAAERNNVNIGGDLLDRIHALSKAHDDEAKKLTTSRKSVTDYIRDLDVLGINVGQAVDSFKAGGEGVGVFTKSLFTARGAAIAFTAVPIIAVLTAVIAFFKSTDEGADKLEQGIGFLTTAFDSLLKGIAPVGKFLVDLFTAPQELMDNLNKKTGVYSVNLVEVAKAAKRAGDAQAEYITTMQQIEDEENKLIVKREQVGAQVDQALLKVKDRSLSEKQKIAILRDAGKAEADLSKIVLKNANDAYNAIVKVNKEKATTRDLTDKEALAEMNAKANVIKAERESANTKQAIRNRETAQIEEEQTKRKALADKAKQDAKDAAQDRVYEAELAVLALKKRGEVSLEIEGELVKRQATLIQKRGELEASGLKKNAIQRKLIEAKTQAELLELMEQQARKLADRAFTIQDARLSAQLALAQKGSEQEFELQKAALTARLDREKSAAVDAIKNKEAQTAELRRLDAQYNADTEQLSKAYAQATINREAAMGAARLQTQLDLGDQTIANDREVAAKRIDLEEDTQVKLLEVERSFGQISNDEYLNRLNAIQSKALAAHRELNKQIEEDERTTQENILDAQLSRVKVASAEELRLQLEKLKVERARAIANAKGTTAELDKINGEFDKKEEDAVESHLDKIAAKINKYIETVSLAKDVLATAYEAQNTALMANLDKQQEAALKSAGTNADLRARIEENFNKKREKLEKEAAEKRRKIASIENLIATAQAETANLKLFATNPILGAITAALILAKAVKTQQLIDSQAFEDGGVYISDGQGAYVRGPGTGKSDSINSKLSNGESVLTAKATDMFYDQLSAMNVAGGGRAFPGAGGEDVPQVTNFAFGGVNQGNGNAELAAQIVQAMRGANFAVAVTDIHKVEDDLIYAKASGDS